MLTTILLAAGLLYLFVGVVVATVRISAHDMPWQLFVFTIIFWPSMWLD
jgi:hypothetical protein